MCGFNFRRHHNLLPKRLYFSSILDPYQLLFPLQNTFFLTTILFQREHRLTRASKNLFFQREKKSLDEECAQKCPLKRKVQPDFHLCIRFASEFPFCSISWFSMRFKAGCLGRKQDRTELMSEPSSSNHFSVSLSSRSLFCKVSIAAKTALVNIINCPR